MKKLFVIAALVVLTTACGRTPGDGAGTGVEDAPAKLAALNERINGSLESRAAGQFLTYMSFQLPIRECMAKAGYSYTPPPWVDPTAGQPGVRPLSYIDVLVPVDERQAARGLYLAEDRRQYTEPPNPGFTSLDAQGQQRYSAQMTVCEPVPGSYDRSFPREALNLSYKLEEALAKPLAASGSLRDMATKGYASCMSLAGYPVKDRKELTEHIRGRFFSEIGSESQLQTARAGEVAAAQADVSCRKDSYPIAMDLIAPAMAKFETDHAAALAELDARWAKIRAEAASARAKMTW